MENSINTNSKRRFIDKEKFRGKSILDKNVPTIMNTKISDSLLFYIDIWLLNCLTLNGYFC